MDLGMTKYRITQIISSQTNNLLQFVSIVWMSSPF